MATSPSLPHPAEEEPQTILFRPSKKRKIYRQRARDDEAGNDEQAGLAEPMNTNALSTAENGRRDGEAEQQSLEELIASSGVVGGEEVEGTPVSMAEILRLRKRNKRLGGVEFRAEGGQGRLGHQGDENAERGLALRGQEEGEEVDGGGGGVGAPRRFAPQTGTVGDVNKHMMEYIDSQIAKQRRAEASSASVQAPATSAHTFRTTPSTTGGPASSATKQPLDIQRQPAALGKLQEVDLGAEARARNEERTRRKIAGERSLEEEEDEANKAKKVVKVRLGPDGKPWRGGRRKRRGSEDVKRDMIVEEVLRENRLELYEEPVAPVTSSARNDVDDDGAADDRIAEAFKQEFMDAMAQRRQKKPGPAVPASRTAGGKKEEEVLKGPKLGGSRNSRAAMRDAMLKAGKK